jgi:hypothetical protein
MKQTQIYKDETFSLVSHGGIALSFTRTHGGAGVSLFMQGDDARLFFMDAEAYARVFPKRPERQLMEYLWDNYYFGE